MWLRKRSKVVEWGAGSLLAVIVTLIATGVHFGFEWETVLNALFSFLFLLVMPLIAVQHSVWLIVPVVLVALICIVQTSYVEGPWLRFTAAFTLGLWILFGAWCTARYLVI